MGARTSVYLDDSLQAAVKASGVPLAELVRRGLAVPENRQVLTDSAGQNPHASADSGAAVKNSLTTSSSLSLPAGEPSPGVLCMGPRCLERNTRKYGLRQLPLCAACAAALQGKIHKRELPESTARAVRRGAA